MNPTQEEIAIAEKWANKIILTPDLDECMRQIISAIEEATAPLKEYIALEERNHPFYKELVADFEAALGPHPTIPNGQWIRRITELKEEVDRLKKFHVEDMRVTNESASFHMKRCRELEAAAGFCDKHQPDGGSRNCLVCACEQMEAALSKISYLCGEQNDMRQSAYDTHCNEDEVVHEVIGKFGSFHNDHDLIEWLEKCVDHTCVKLLKIDGLRKNGLYFTFADKQGRVGDFATAREAISAAMKR